MRKRLEAAQAAFNAGDIGRAAQDYRAIIDEIPDQPDALHMLGAIAHKMGRSELALELFNQTVRAAPKFAAAWNNRALVLRVMRRNDEALESARKCVAIDPNYAGGWDVIGLLAQAKGDYAAAIPSHERALKLDPASTFAWNNYAVALAVTGRFADAHQAVKKALARNPAMAIAHLTLGNIYSAAGYPERSIACYRQAAVLDPSLREAVFTEGVAHMLTGAMEEGWTLMERRPFFEDARFGALPRWRGEKTGHLIIHAEQGGGDALQFLRYIPLIRGRAAKITIEAAPGFRRLAAAHMPDVGFITPADPLPQADAYVPLLSLPYIMKTRVETVPASVPYIEAKEEWCAPWRERLAAIPRPRAGLVWVGNPRHLNDRNRSLSLDFFGPLIEAARPHIVSVQKGAVPGSVAAAGIFDAEPWLEDFAATAGLLAELDLLISPDTAPIHLAGAMGKPVWTLLPFTPDWRWMLGREDTPWYPTMRLFRQTAWRDWPPVVARVTEELKKFIGGDASVLDPPRWTGPPLRQHPQALPLPDEN